MKLKLQPTNSNTCGHHCIAMVAKCKVEKVIKLIGHENGTRTIDLHNAFKRMGYKTPKKLIRFKAWEDELPDLCIIKYRWPKEIKRTGHWVIYRKGMIVDPGCGVYPFDKAFIASLDPNVKPTSYLPIIRPMRK